MKNCNNNIQKSKTVDPIAYIRGHPSSISSICFIHKSANNSSNNAVMIDGGTTSSLDDEELNRYFLDQSEDYLFSATPQILASCDVSGNAFLWNTTIRRKIAQFGFAEKKLNQGTTSLSDPGLSLRRIMPSSSTKSFSRQILYHTRGVNGLVSVLDVETLSSSVFQVQTQSSTFCASAPCRGDANLIVTPTYDECVAKIYDIRMGSNAALILHGAGRPGSASRNHDCGTGRKEHGMLTSLSMVISRKGIPIVACGMESGEIYFHDCRVLRIPCPNKDKQIPLTGSMQLSRDPILSLDLFESSSVDSDSVIAVTGAAGDAVDLSSAASDMSTGSIVKGTICPERENITVKVQTRFQTCNLGENAAGGKPGISCLRFREDGKLFAVGGWDHRARIFTRRGKQIAILKGHDKTVTAVDWSTDYYTSGCLFSTGSSDGKILLWRLLLGK